MEAALSKHKAMDNILVGIQFDDRMANATEWPDNITITLRFPAVMRMPMLVHPLKACWRTNLLFPLFPRPGPLAPDDEYGGTMPGYKYELFLTVQNILSQEIIEKKTGKSVKTKVLLKRMPRLPFKEDDLTIALERFVSMILMLCFAYTFVNTVRAVTQEKELQLKETMKIMGIPSWLHWLAWFIKQLTYLSVSVVLLVILLKIPLKKMSNGEVFAVLTYTPFSMLLFFLVLFVVASLAFCFMVSSFFNTANTAASFMGLAWFATYSVYLLSQGLYEQTSLTTKILLSLISNSAIGFALQLIVAAESFEASARAPHLPPERTKRDAGANASLPRVVNDRMHGFKDLAVAYNNRDIENEDSLLRVVHDEEPAGVPLGVDIRNLTKVYGKKKKAVDDLSFRMYENEITVLLGHNGAGKTTTLSMMTGMIPPTSGTVYINGHDIVMETEEARKSIGLCPQHNVLFPDLTVTEHIIFYGRIKGVSKKNISEEVDRYLTLLELEEKRNVLSQHLSGGQQRRLSVCIAMCGSSRVVLLDEPTSGLDPSARRALWDLLQKEKKGRTIILTTHFMDEADVLADRIAIMAAGKLQCIGTPYFLKKHYGIGYKLTMVKRDNCNIVLCTEFIKSYVPDVTVNTDIGSELTYILPTSHVNTFPDLLKNLEDLKESLKIDSYGLSVTTLEEVFMSTGAENFAKTESPLILKQRSSTASLPLPPLTLNLKPFKQTQTLISHISGLSETENEIMTAYKDYFVNSGNDNMMLVDLGNKSLSEHYKYLHRTNLAQTRFEIIVGATFAPGNITGWFSNYGYHDSAISLALVNNAILRALSPNSTLNFVNHPLPFSINDQERISGAKLLQRVSGVQPIVMWGCALVWDWLWLLLINLCIIVTLAAYQEYTLSTFEELGRVFLVLIVFSFAIIPIHYLASFYFQAAATGFAKMCFLNMFTELTLPPPAPRGIAAHAFRYCFSCMPFLIAEVLRIPEMGDPYWAKILDWVFAPLPLYCLSRSFRDMSVTSFTLISCNALCEQYSNVPNCTALTMCQNLNISVCCLEENPYLKWEEPGIARYLFIMAAVGVIGFAIMLMKEYELFSKAMYIMVSHQPMPIMFRDEIEVEDSDVAFERAYVRSLSRKELSTHSLVVSNLTKVFDTLLAVDRLCFATQNSPTNVSVELANSADLTVINIRSNDIAVRKGECFGLLGVNGAGKTTTFKMLTGATRVSHGDALVLGYSIKTEPEEVHRRIVLPAYMSHSGSTSPSRQPQKVHCRIGVGRHVYCTLALSACVLHGNVFVVGCSIKTKPGKVCCRIADGRHFYLYSSSRLRFYSRMYHTATRSCFATPLRQQEKVRRRVTADTYLYSSSRLRFYPRVCHTATRSCFATPLRQQEKVCRRVTADTYLYSSSRLRLYPRVCHTATRSCFATPLRQQEKVCRRVTADTYLYSSSRLRLYPRVCHTATRSCFATPLRQQEKVRRRVTADTYLYSSSRLRLYPRVCHTATRSCFATPLRQQEKLPPGFLPARVTLQRARALLPIKTAGKVRRRVTADTYLYSSSRLRLYPRVSHCNALVLCYPLRQQEGMPPRRLILICILAPRLRFYPRVSHCNALVLCYPLRQQGRLPLGSTRVSHCNALVLCYPLRQQESSRLALPARVIPQRARALLPIKTAGRRRRVTADTYLYSSSRLRSTRACHTATRSLCYPLRQQGRHAAARTADTYLCSSSRLRLYPRVCHTATRSCFATPLRQQEKVRRRVTADTYLYSSSRLRLYPRVCHTATRSCFATPSRLSRKSCTTV
ncbi:ATP-binding cassette sub-family A member 3 [Eumeta japonica]|uniref:ATP-binding cassette sub-family A member 3 n=1 Tax=Eumeta variegata TaxID=151549 RepID=A0A4C1ZUX3_EUMVA|nr:ATP-binding cassette sub-family A member 3 [Eumeta japonica]